MRTTSLKTIYLTEEELKQAIVNFLRLQEGPESETLRNHLMNNATEMGWSQDGKEFIVSMDGEFEDKT